MSSTLLSRQELADLTGMKQPKRMTEWLHKRSWVYEPGARRGDIPKVDRAYYQARMSGTLSTSTLRRAGPRVDWMLPQ
jgi:hypothetical protein